VEILSVFVVAIGLSMDAVAAAVSRAIAAERAGWREALLTGTWFGAFQAGMPVIGWLVGERFGPLVAAWDHWIAFGLLAAIGSKMIWDGWRDEGEAPRALDPFGARTLATLALATSIDALAVGLTLPLLGAPLVVSVTIIGVTTAILSALGVLLGRRLGAAFGRRLDVVGGVILIGVGTKILVAHLAA
jgi:putative Mn2+ efflux pump MntP